MKTRISKVSSEDSDWNAAQDGASKEEQNGREERYEMPLWLKIGLLGGAMVFVVLAGGSLLLFGQFQTDAQNMRDQNIAIQTDSENYVTSSEKMAQIEQNMGWDQAGSDTGDLAELASWTDVYTDYALGLSRAYGTSASDASVNVQTLSALNGYLDGGMVSSDRVSSIAAALGQENLQDMKSVINQLLTSSGTQELYEAASVYNPDGEDFSLFEKRIARSVQNGKPAAILLGEDTGVHLVLISGYHRSSSGSIASLDVVDFAQTSLDSILEENLMQEVESMGSLSYLYFVPASTEETQTDAGDPSSLSTDTTGDSLDIVDVSTDAYAGQ